MISANIQNEQTLIIAVFGLFYLAYSLWAYLRRNMAETSDKVIILMVFCTCFNPYVFDLLTHSSIDSLQQLTWAIFILSDAVKPQANLHYLLLGITTSLNPSNFLYFIIKIIISTHKKLKTLYFSIGLIMVISYLHFSSQLPFNYLFSMYFPQAFEPQFNLMWILYAHMFDRYLQLYQTLFLVLQTSSAYLIQSLELRHNFKIVLLTYFKVYCNYQCSELCLVLSLGVCFILMHKQISITIDQWGKLDKCAEVMKVKTLSLIIVIANIAFFPLDKILLSKYLHDFTLNIGYIFLFFGFPWILNSIYLAQISININALNEAKQKIETISEQPSIK